MAFVGGGGQLGRRRLVVASLDEQPPAGFGQRFGQGRHSGVVRDRIGWGEHPHLVEPVTASPFECPAHESRGLLAVSRKADHIDREGGSLR